LKAFIFLFLFFFSSISSAYMAADCSEIERLCIENACAYSNGEVYDGECIEGEDFDSLYYQNATGECALLKERCEESSGFMLPSRNMSCCGPVFVLLAVLGFAAGSRFK
jgi:hypothetical protein